KFVQEDGMAILGLRVEPGQKSTVTRTLAIVKMMCTGEESFLAAMLDIKLEQAAFAERQQSSGAGEAEQPVRSGQMHDRRFRQTMDIGCAGFFDYATGAVCDSTARGGLEGLQVQHRGEGLSGRVCGGKSQLGRNGGPEESSRAGLNSRARDNAPLLF